MVIARIRITITMRPIFSSDMCGAVALPVFPRFVPGVEPELDPDPGLTTALL
jgi:hypothetical protein